MQKISRLLGIFLTLAIVTTLLCLNIFATETEPQALNVAKVGNVEYETIDEAIEAWTNGTTLTLLSDVTLSDVVTLKSTEHHILDLGTYIMTAASGKHAIEITCEGRSSASYALTINADVNNPGGITAVGKSCIYYKKSGTTKDRPIILINNGVFTGSYSLNINSNGNTNCPQIWINGGTFNSYINLTKCMLRVSGGTFHAAINCTGDSSAYREIKGGRFKSWQFMTADAATKFWVGSGNGNYNVGLYVDKEGYLVVGGPVITEVSAEYPAVATNYSKWSSYLKYSAAATYGLFYEDVDMATAKHGEDNVTVWVAPTLDFKIADDISGDATVIEEIKSTTIYDNFSVSNLPDDALLIIELVGVGDKIVYDVAPMVNGTEVEPTAAITFRLPIPASVTNIAAKVYHDGELMGTYTIKGEGSAKYVEVSSADFSEFAVEPTDTFTVAYGTLEIGPANTLADVISCNDTLSSLMQWSYPGETPVVTVNGDFVITEDFTINGAYPVVFDLNGKTLTVAEGVTLSVGSNVQLTGDGTIVGDVKLTDDENSELNISYTVDTDDLSVVDASGNEMIQGDNGTFVTCVAKIGNNYYATLSEALAAASSLTGDVVVEILEKVTLNVSISGSFDSITFIGKDTDAEIYLDVQGYITATGKKVAFEDLKLSKAEGGYITNAGFMNLAFGIFGASEVSYTNCTFANGAYASYGVNTFTDCTFYRSYDRYGFWAYGDADIVIDGCTFADIRGIKMYAEGKLKVGDLTVKDTDFTAAGQKPAIVLTSGNSVTLEGNTYNENKGVFELDLDGVPNGTTVTSDVAPTCINDNGVCGVLVDGKIYTTVAQAAEVATSGSKVTLLHNSTETVEFAQGVVLDKNGYTADSVTVKSPYVAEVNGTKYETLAEALAVAQSGDEIVLLADVSIAEGTDVTIPNGIILNGNGFAILSGGADHNTTTNWGYVVVDGTLTIKGHTKIEKLSAASGDVVNVGQGATLEMVGVGRISLGHSATFNIRGSITDAKTADKENLQASFIAPGASFTGVGINFNVTNAYIKFTVYSSSKNSSANNTFNFNITNSIWEQTGNLQFSVPTSGKDPTVNFNLKDSVLDTTGHLIFGVTKGEIVIDNSNVNVGTRRQLENRSTMTIKNGSVVYGTVATSQNAINPGTLIVENATYDVTGEFSGATVATGNLIIKSGANITIGKVTNANITIDGTNMVAGELANFSANLSSFTGELALINNNKLEASIVDGKIVLSLKPVAQIGDAKFESIQAAVDAAQAGDVIEIIGDVSDETVVVDKNLTITGSAVLNNVSISANGATELTVSGLNFTGNSWINVGTATKLTVSGVTADVTPSNTSATNSRSAFISLGRSEQHQLVLTVENCSIVSRGGSDPILGWAAVTEVNLVGNTFGAANAYQTNSDSVKFMGIAQGAIINIANNTVYSNYNGIVLGQNTTRGNSYTVIFSGNTFLGGADHIWIEVSGSTTYNGNIIVTSDNTINGSAIDVNGIVLKSNLNTFTGYAGIDVVLDSEGKVVGGVMKFAAEGTIADGYELDDNGNVVEAKNYVAEVNGTKYETLAEAIAAAQSGDEIILIADAEISGTTNIAKSITINGKGFKITQAEGFTANGSNAMFDIMSGATVTFENLTFDSVKTSAILRTVDASIVMDGCTVQNCEQTVAQGLFRLACGNATITDSKFLNNKCTMVISFGYDAANDTDVLTIDGCLFEGNTCGETAVVYFADGDYGKVTNTKFIDNSVSSAGNAATLYMGWGSGFEVSGCLFDGNSVSTTHATTKRFAQSIFADGCAIENNIFLNNTATRNGEEVSTAVAVAAYYGAASVSGNYWNGGKPAYTVEYTRNEVEADSYFTQYDAENGTLSDEVKMVAKVGKYCYTTLAEALAAVEEGQTITILEGTVSEGTIKLPAELKNVTFRGEDGAILKDMTIMASDGNSFSYIGLTFDGITFENSRLIFTGWRNGDEIIEDLTITNCVFKNLSDSTNNAAVHINKDVSEPVKNFTFTNNVVDGLTGGSKSGIYMQATGEIVIEGNTFNNIVFRPALVQLADCDGVVDDVVISNNNISNTTRLQVYGSEEGPSEGPWTPSGTDTLEIAISGNIFQNISGQYICTWGINGETDISKNYYDGDVSGRIYWNNEQPTDEATLKKLGLYPIYTELNTDGTINVESAYTPKIFVAQIGDDKYETLAEALAVAQSGEEIVLLADIEESIAEIKNVILTTTVPNGVTFNNTFVDETDYLVLSNIKIGSGITMNAIDVLSSGESENIIEGTLNVTGVYYNRYNAKTIIQNGGKLTTTGMIVNRYNTEADAGIYVYGDGDASTVEISCGDTLGTYSGTFYAKDAVVEAKMLWIDYWKNGSGEPASNPQSKPVFENAVLNVTSELRLYQDASLTLKNTAVTAGKVQIRQDATPTVKMDAASSIKANSVENLSGASINAVLGADGYVSFKTLILSGSGTEEDPYTINNVDELILFRDSVNAGDTKYNADGVYVVLGADIDMSGIDWSINIGDAADTSFDGIFDGKNHKISNLTSTETKKDPYGYICTGLFGCIAGNAEVKNLTIENVNIDATFSGNNVGALVGFVWQGKPVIENVTISGNININAPGAYGVGTVVGYSYQSKLTIKNTKVIGADGSAITSKSGVGGIIGYSGGNVTISSCSVENLSLSGTGLAGGIVGITSDVNSVINSIVKKVEITVGGEYWKNSAAVVIGTMATNGTVVSGTTYENVIANGVAISNMVGSVYTEKPTTAVPAVQATIGDKYYATFAEALAAAQNGDTITILAGEYSEAISIAKLEKNITIKGAADFATTLTGGIYIGVDNNVNESGSIAIEGINFTDKGITICDLANVTITGNKFTDISGIAAVYIQADNYTENVTISNNVINNVIDGAGIRVRSAKDITIDGNVVAGTRDNSITLESAIQSNTGSVVITNNKLSDWANNDKNEGRAIRISNGTGDAQKTITVEKNVMVADSNALEEYLKITEAVSTVSINENYWGGKNPNESGVVKAPAQADNYYADEDLSNLVTIAYVAEVNGTKYESLAEAIAAAQDGETVVLLADVTLDATITIEKAITIDLGGKTVTGKDGAIVFNVKADTTIKNGTILGNKSGTSSGLIDIYANLTMDGVTVQTSKIIALRFKQGGFNATLTNCNITGQFKGYGASVWNIVSGTYKASSTSVTDQLNGTASVSGGTFYYAIEHVDCAPGYTVVDNGDGTYGVKYSPVAFVDANNNGILDDGEKVYGSLEAIFDTYQSGDVYIVLTDDTVIDTQVDTDVDAKYYLNTNVAEGVTVEFAFADDWNYIQKMYVGENVTIKAPYLLVWTELDLYGTITTEYLYITTANVVVNEGAVINANTGEATVQVKNGATLTVNGTVNTAILNVWVGESKLVVSGDNAEVNASWIDIWDGAPSVTVEDGATIEAKKIKASRGGNIAVTNATIVADSIELGHNGESAGKLTESGNSTINGEIKMTAIGSTVSSDGGLNVTTQIEDHKVVFENGEYKVVEKVYLAQIGDVKFETVTDAVNYAKNEGITDLVITLIGENTKASAIALNDAFDLYYTSVFDNVTLKQADPSKVYYIAGIYTGSRTNPHDGKFIFDGVNIHVTDQYIFEANVKLINNSIITSSAEANCFFYSCWVTIEPGSMIKGVIEDFRGGHAVIDGGRNDGLYNDNPSFQDAILIINWSGDSLVIKDGAYVKVNSANEVGRITINGGASIEVLNSKLEAVQWINVSGELRLNIGSLVATDKITGNGKIIIDATDLSSDAVQLIEADMSGFTGTIEIVGNNFADFEITANGVVVNKIVPVAQIGSQYFVTLAEAFAAANDGDTIVLLADIELDEIIVNNNKVVFDLNGKTITGTDNTTKNFSLIDNRSELTITGNGTITLSATVNSGWNRYSAVLANNPGGKLIIENGTIEHLGGTDMAYGIDNLTNGKGTYAETIINGGTVKSTYRAVRQFLNGVEAQNILTINGGTIEGTNKAIFFHDPSKNANSGKLTISENAEINGDIYLFVTAGSTEWPVEVSINTSAVNGEVITGNVPNGYITGETDGIYGVSKDPSKLYIYTLADLIAFRNAVNSGANYYEGVTVYLAADIDLAGENWTPIGSAYLDHGFMGNFDGNGFKIKNLTMTNLAVDSDGYAYAGFFGVTEGIDANNQNFIKNLVIENVTIETNGHIVAAAIAYPYYTVISDITVCGDIAIKGGDYTAGVLAYTRRCVNASGLTVSGNAGSYITGAQTVGGVISDIQMNGGLTANYSNFSASGLTITGDKMVGGISGIIAKQTLDGATVKNVVLVCSDSRVGIVSGALGATSTVKNTTVENVTGASAIVGASYDSGYLVVNNGDVYASVAPVAEVNGVKYATFAEAIKAAKSGDTVTLLAGEYSEAISIAKLEKNITIKGAADYATVLTGGLYIGIDDNNNESGSIVIEGIKFEGKGIAVNDLANVTITGNKFSDIADIAAIYVQADNYTENVIISNNVINNVIGGAGIRVRSAKDITIDGNVVAGTKDNSITLESALQSNTGSVVITNNKLSDWANNDKNEGRAIRISNGMGDAQKTITVENNVMVADANALEEYLKITEAVSTVSINENYWGGKNPNESGVVKAPAQADNYYADEELSNLVTITYVAEVNGTKYTSFADAIVAAQTGETVTMLADVKLSDILVINKAITLDGKGHTLTSTAGRAINVATDGTVTIKNLTIDASGERAINVITKPATLTIENVTATAANYTVNVASSAGAAKVTINNSTLNGLCTVNVSGVGAEVTITDSTINCNDNNTTAGESYAALCLNKASVGGSIIATNTIVNVTAGSDSEKGRNGAENGTVTINGSTDGVSVTVAVITYPGSDYYYGFTSIAGAIEFAKAGDTITLIRDVTLSDILVINKAITLDGNGHKLTSTAGRAINVTGADGVTIKNLTINASGERAINIIQKATNVTIDNVTATASNYTVNVASSAPNAVVAIKNSTLNGLCTVNVAGAGAKVTVDNSTINCNDNNTTAGESYAALALNKEAVGGSIVATNTTVNVAEGSDSVKGRNGALNGTVTINGSTEDVYETVAVITYAGQDSYHGFYSLADAIEFAKDGDTITLIRDIVLDATVANSKEIIIDLNGNTISGTDTTTASYSLITNNGTLTIKDSSEAKSGKIVLNATNDTGFNRYSTTVSNTVGGKLVIESGTIEHLGGHSMSYAIDNLTNGKGTYAETIINGGTIKSAYIGIRQFLNGVEAQNILTINGGTVTGGNSSIYFQDPSTNANSGTLTIGENAKIEKRIYLGVTAGSTEWPVTVSIAKSALADGVEIVSKNVPTGYEIKEVNGVYGIAYNPNKIVSYSLALEGEIAYRVTYALDTATYQNENAKIVFTFIRDGETVTVEIPASQGYETKAGMYQYSVDLYSYEMTTEIESKLVISGEEQLNCTGKASIKNYAEYVMASNDPKYTEELKELVKSMLNYGAYAQLYFGYNLDNLATDNYDVSGVANESIVNVNKAKGSAEGIAIRGVSLELESRITLRYTFTISEGYTIDQYTFKCGDDVITPVKLSETEYRLDIEDINVYDLDKEYTVVVNDSYSITSSAISYASIVVNGSYGEDHQNLCKAMYMYNEAGNTYFEGK